MTPTATLARSITWTGSKQTYYTAKWMVDKDLVNDFFRAYAYFRWADDVIDVTAQTDEERLTFVQRQRDLIERLYSNSSVNGLSPEEEIAAELIRNERGDSGRLQSFIRNMFAIIEFDAQRKGRLISQEELNWYTESLGKSVTDGLQYFIGNDHPYPITEDRNLASHGAHVSHLLRDMLSDTADGFINIPRALSTRSFTHARYGSLFTSSGLILITLPPIRPAVPPACAPGVRPRSHQSTDARSGP